ncbi:hypothetical protein [Streptomyces sp. NBC_01717]|uniref:hypothetical protein n=1 Tax=Streptomyces sp. NBC_01717 TaxID=2975918 RepID=UPI003FCDBA56
MTVRTYRGDYAPIGQFGWDGGAGTTTYADPRTPPGDVRPQRPRTPAVRVLRGDGRTERENIREATLEGLDTAARKGSYGGRRPVITDDMLHTALRRCANGETVEGIQPDLLIPTGRRNGQSPSLSSIYRALAEHEKAQAYSGVPGGRRDGARRLRRPSAARPQPQMRPSPAHRPDGARDGERRGRQKGGPESVS